MINKHSIIDLTSDLGQALLGFTILLAATWIGKAIDAAAARQDGHFMLVSCEGAQPIGKRA